MFLIGYFIVLASGAAWGILWSAEMYVWCIVAAMLGPIGFIIQYKGIKNE